MASTTPPFAVPSSLVSTMPVTPSASLNCRACASAFWPWLASSTSRTSCGAAASSRPITRFTFLSSSIRLALRVQTSGGIGDQDVDAARLRRLHRVEDDRRRIGAGRLGDHRHVVALAPDLQLLDRGGAERVAGGEQHLQPSSPAAARELADRRRLAGAVDADDEDHERPACPSITSGRARRRQDLEHRAAQRLQQRVEIARARCVRPVRAVRSSMRFRRLDADVGGDQSRLELVEHAVVDAAAGHQVREIVGQPRIAAVEPRAQSRDQAGTRLGSRPRSRRLGLGLRLEAEKSHEPRSRVHRGAIRSGWGALARGLPRRPAIS